MRKRVLSLLLAICLVVGLLPPTTLAAEGGTPPEITVKARGTTLFTGVTEGIHYAKVVSNTPSVTTVEDPECNIILDYSEPTPVLTLKGVSITSTANNEEPIAVSGDGALKIIIDGNCTFGNAKKTANGLDLQMKLGTTITSKGNSELVIEATNINNRSPIYTNYNLTLDHANLDLKMNRHNHASSRPAIFMEDGGNLEIIGGNLKVETGADTAALRTASGISVRKGMLTISGGANITIDKKSTGVASPTASMFGIYAKDGIDFTNGKLTVTDAAAYAFNGEDSAYRSYTLGKINIAAPATGDNVKITLDGVPFTGEIVGEHEFGEHRSVSIEYVCGEHAFDDDITTADACTKCGKVNDVAETITMTVGDVIDWNVGPGATYYATTTEEGVVADLGTTEPSDGKWNIKLDNNSPVAELTLKGATITKKTEISGKGALKITVADDSSVTTGSAHALSLSMEKGTTITSKDNSELDIVCTGSGNYYSFKVTGDLTLDHANLSASLTKHAGSYSYAALVVSGDMNIIGGTLDVTANGTTGSGIQVSGTLDISGGAKVTVTKTSVGKTSMSRNMCGIAAGALNFSGGKLTISDAADYEFHATYRSGSLCQYTGGKAQAQGLVPALASPAEGDRIDIKLDGVLYQGNIADAGNLATCRNISFEYVCGTHKFDDDIATADACQKCGELSKVPSPITVTVAGSIDWKDVAPGETRYATTDANGNVVDISTTYADDTTTPWNIKLDNNNPVAELTLKGATIKTTGEVKALVATGVGALNITVDGESTITSGKANTITLGMEGGTTITSVTKDSKLTAEFTYAGNYKAIAVEAGSLTLDHAHLYLASNAANAKWAYAALYAYNDDTETSFDVTIKGGTLTIHGKNHAAEGILCNNLTISDYAVVTAINTAGDPNSINTSNAKYLRTGVAAVGTITIDTASLWIINKAGCWAHAINKMPVVSGPVLSQYSTSAEGTELQVLNPADRNANIDYPYVGFAYDCMGENQTHTYGGGATDPDCDVCGLIRKVPKDVTIRIITDGGVKQETLPLSGDYDRKVNVPAGEIYYGFANADGLVTEFKAYDDEPTGWAFMLDNTEPVAQLVFNNAYLRKSDAYKDATTGDTTNLFTVTGEGELEIVARGESTLRSVGSAISTGMAGGTTYTSENGGKLILNQGGTNNLPSLTETAGKLTFNQANLYLHSSNQNINWPFIFIHATRDMQVSGGKLEMVATSYSANGINVGGDLTIDNLAIVNIRQTCTSADAYTGVSGRPTSPNYRYGVHVGGIFKIDDASLHIYDNAKNMFEYSVNKMPELGDKTKSQYSENIDGSDAKALNPNDPTAKIDYPYVSFAFDCKGEYGDHNFGDGATDPDCDICGLTRKVSKDVTIRIFTDGGVKLSAPFSDDNDRKVTVPAGKIYYGFATANGLVTEFKAYDTEPSGWAFMLDNSEPVAKLVFNNAYLRKSDAYKNPEITNLLTISGEGALKIVARGESTLKTVGSAISTQMAGGTTYVSENGGKLTINQSGSSNKPTLTETAGKLTFSQANLYLESKSQNVNYPFIFIHATSDMQVSGGKLEMIATSYSARGILVGGDLTLDNLAIVNIRQACTAANTYTGVTGRPTDPNYRYGVHVSGKFTIDGASLYVIDNAKNMFEYSVNKMPEVTGNSKSHYSENIDGSNVQELNPNDLSAKIEYPYVAFAYNCMGIAGTHTYGSEGDRDCNLCGAVRDVPRDITIRIVADGGVKDEERNSDVTRPFKEGYCTEVTIRAKEVYYGTTDEKGLVTSFTQTAPEEWTIKLDNTKPVAELTFNNAYLRKAGTYRDITSYDSNGNPNTTATNLLTVSGEGKLKVITKGDTTLVSIYGNVMETRMVGGTTFSSENGAKLTLNQNGSSGYSALAETKGELNFENAIIHATNNRNNPNYSDAIIDGSLDVNVSGGSIEIESINCSTEGLVVGGSLKLTNHAKVRLIGQTQKDNRYVANVKNPRYAVQVTGDIIIDDSSMRIMDAIGNWDFAINKSPKLIGSITAKYSESADGTDLKALNPEDSTKPIEYPYVEYVIACAEHDWDNAADNECNRCGLIRAVPHSIQVAFQFGTAKLETLIWDAKVGEIYYATTTEDGFVEDLGKLDSEPTKWNIKLDNTGAEAVLTFKGATITRKVNTLSTDTVFGLKKTYQGTVMAQGAGALRVVTEKASTIATQKKYSSIVTSMVGGTTFESKNNAKLTVTNNGKTPVFYGINELVGNLTFDHANILVQTRYSNANNSYATVSTPRNMTVIGGRVEINASGKASIGLIVNGDLLVKDNGILLVSTTSKPGSGTCKKPAYGVKVDGNITVNDATLMVKNFGTFWAYLINKMPILVNAGSYSSATSTKESKLEAFTAEAGSDLTGLEAKKFVYFSNAKPGTLVDNIADAEAEEEDDDFFFDDLDNPFAGDTVNLTLLFVLTTTSAAALVILFSKKRIFRK